MVILKSQLLSLSILFFPIFYLISDFYHYYFFLPGFFELVLNVFILMLHSF